MNERLEEIIRYKTGGKKIPFAPLYVIYPRQAFQSGEGG